MERRSNRRDKSDDGSAKKRRGSEDGEENNGDFTYLDFKSDLRKIFRLEDLVEDEPDFWKFVNKFEDVEKKRGQSDAEDDFDRLSLINFRLSTSDEKLYSRIPFREGRMLSKRRVKNFIVILLSYLDFDQKQKFAKFIKLRQAQADLPVYKFKDEIVKSVADERVVIIAGDTGCGKSTQVPRYLLKAGYNRIACTQPRRIACIALAKRVAYETLCQFGEEIGYQIRFEKQAKQQTNIVFITEGLLLRQVGGGDGSVFNYDVVVLDEVHERHLDADFLLGVFKCLLHQKTDFKLVLMSATINLELFVDYFGGNAKVIQVPGRLHPIETHYRPITDEDKNSKTDKLNPAPYVRIMHLIDDKYPTEERGDLLIFLSGMSEITTVVDAANAYNEKVKKWIILPLHSSLSIEDQDKVFDYAPEGMRKCIVSTNIAETSITIDGIRFVIDSGMVKEMSYDPICRMQLLKEFWVSKASAEQRKGRAGRTGPGVCYRLYAEADYNSLADFNTAEISRVPLESLLLQMMAMGLPDPRKFPFIQPPPDDNIENAITALKQHCAVTSNEKLTAMGVMLSRLPVDIPLGKMLIMGSMFNQIEPVLSLAAALSVQSPFTNKAYRDQECQTARKALESDHGDCMTLLNALKEWLEVKSVGGGGGSSSSSWRDKGASKRWCKRRGLEEQRFYEMVKLRAQFKDLLKDCGLLKDDLIHGAEAMSSAERALRHGELRLLKSLKRAHNAQTSGGNKKRNFLKPQDGYTIVDEHGDEPGCSGGPSTGDGAKIDIRDVDFRLANDQSKLQKLLSGSTACSYKDLTMIKVILCSGLYPQFAIADEFNHCKGVSDQLFHTRTKPFVFLHPLSYFGNNSQVLQLSESDIVNVVGFSSRNPASSKHQLLCYMSLLETSKPYLVNTMRMPAAQTLLLFANQIHSNVNFTRLICDSWIQLKFAVPPAIEKLVLMVVKIRAKWELLLKLRLEEKESQKLELDLASSLIEFMGTEIVYSMKRLLPADLKTMYCDNGSALALGAGESKINPLAEDYTIHPNSEFGGLQLTSYLTYNCLLNEDMESEVWDCENCGLTAPLTTLEKLQHRQTCSAKNSDSKQESEVKNKPAAGTEPMKANSQNYFCPKCEENLILTPVQILKHKKSHSAG